MVGATMRIKLSVLSNKIKCKTSVNLQLTCHPAISSSCISNFHFCLINFMLINKHNEMETVLYVITISGHSVCSSYFNNFGAVANLC